MFAKLWKRSASVESNDAFQFTIERQRGEPIRFNGTLQVESVGETRPGHRPGDPWHKLQVYRLDSGGHAVVIEFHINSNVIAVDAGIVGSIAEVDDFFCMHAGEHFHRMALDAHRDDDRDAGDAILSDRQLEQRVLEEYDRQILSVLNLLNTERA